MNKKFYYRTSAIAMLSAMSSGAMAQGLPGEADGVQSTDIVVTGSRIVREGYEAPTPTIAVSADDLQASAPQNLTEGLNRLPVFSGSTTQEGSGGGLGSGGVNSVGSFLNLRNFGSIRTLILLDGRRMPPTNFDGDVDVDTLPQALVQRVDVVTGGASAVYGSDAVTGVVNYILDRNFTGVKGTVQTGFSSYGDGARYRANVAAGTPLMGGAGHLLVSAEWSDSKGVPAKEDRPWFHNQLRTGTGSEDRPYLTVDEGRENERAFAGLIRRTSSINPDIPDSLTNMIFNDDGTLRPFIKGASTNTGNFSAGGDGTYHPYTSLIAASKKKQAFGRFQYEFSPSLTGFAQVGYSESESHHSQATANRSDTSTNIVEIFSGNAYLHPSVQQIMTDNDVDSLILSIRGLDHGRPDFEINTQSLIGTVGLEGTISDSLRWDLSYMYGRGKTNNIQHVNGNNRNFYAAIDAVDEGEFLTGTANGNIVCRVSLTSPGLYPGCVPMNVMGRGNVTPEAIAFTTNDTAWYATNRTDNIMANITGDAFELWAGPVSFAIGGEYRRQTLLQTSTDDPIAPVDFTGLRGGFTDATLAYTGVIVAGAQGEQEVWEANAELVIPLLKDSPVGQMLDLSLAGRYTHYKTSGAVQTWKAGLDYQPIDSLRVRLVASRDIRAPTLYDLFAATQVRNSGLNDPLTGVQSTTQQVSGGNVNLTPEIANTYTAGIVFSPDFLPGFNASVDYFNIRIKDAIGSVGVATQIRECTESGGTSPFCDNIERPLGNTDTSAGNFPTRYFNRPVNSAYEKTEGFDFAVGYRTSLEGLGPDSSLAIRVLSTYQPHLYSRSYPSADLQDSAGTANSFAKLRITSSINLNIGDFEGTIVNRFKGKVKRDADPELVNLDPPLGAYDITDINLAYNVAGFGAEGKLFLNISNVFNRDPRINAGGSPGQVTPVVDGDDVMGRYMTVGLRFNF